MVLASGPKDASQGTVDRVREVSKNALQTLETSVTDVWLIFSGAEAQNASRFILLRGASRALRSFDHT